MISFRIYFPATIYEPNILGKIFYNYMDLLECYEVSSILHLLNLSDKL